MQRPSLLLQISDLGTDSKAIELALRKYFHLAECWGAILVFGEAEVHLKRRGHTERLGHSVLSGTPLTDTPRLYSGADTLQCLFVAWIDSTGKSTSP